MLIPIRCFSCGKPVASKYEEFKKKVESGESNAKALDEVGLERYCCRRMILSQEELIDEIIPYPRF